MIKNKKCIVTLPTVIILSLLFSMPAYAHTDPFLNAVVANSQTIGQFIILGIKHIWIGYDHILFLTAVIIIGVSIKETVKVITSFTIAHSITLLLAALQIIFLPSVFVEAAIAVSICFIAVENIFMKDAQKHRWMITFGFGLIHGFGFASVLQEYITNKSKLVSSVIAFNVGVEIGQITIFAVMLPFLFLLRKKIEFRKVTNAVSVFVFAMGFIWFIERVFHVTILGI